MLRRILFGSFLLAAGMAAGQGKYTVDKIVAVVGNAPILYSEVEEVGRMLTDMRRQQGYTSDKDVHVEALEELLQQKLLYQQAQIDSLTINMGSVIQRTDEHMTELVSQAGSVKALEEKFHRPIYEIKSEIQHRFEESDYAQEMRRTVEDKVKITPGEVERFFKHIHKDSIPVIPIQYVYAQITKLPLSSADARLRTREQLLGLRERIINGTRFEVLARMYSEDPASAVQGGDLGWATAEEYEENFANALKKLKPGQVSEVVETMYGYHIIQLIESSGPRYHARHILVKPKFTDDEMLATNHMLDSVANLIRQDSITFEKAAIEFSDDKYSKYNGGLVSNLEYLELNRMWQANFATTKHFMETLAVNDYRALENLQPGEISAAFQTADARGNDMSKIVKLIEIIPSHPATLEGDYLILERMALSRKKEAEYTEWLDKKVGSMFVRISPEFRKAQDFRDKFWLK